MNELTIMNNADTVWSIFDSLDVRETTIKEYNSRIKHFIAFVNDHGFAGDTLLAYKRKLASNEDYSVSTKNKYLVCAKVFLRAGHHKGLIPFDLSKTVKSFQQSKKHKVMGLNDHEVSRICNWMNEHPDQLRERALLCLLLFQGLRQAEICDLRTCDIDLKERVIYVLGKGRDDRDRVYLHEQTYRAMKQYMAVRVPSYDPQNGFVFVSESRRSSRGKLTSRGLRYIIQGILEVLEIERTVHGFRHYFATHLIKNMPGNLLEVAQFTRHRSIEMLQVYNDSLIDQDNLLRYHSAFSDVSDMLVPQHA